MVRKLWSERVVGGESKQLMEMYVETQAWYRGGIQVRLCNKAYIWKMGYSSSGGNMQKLSMENRRLKRQLISGQIAITEGQLQPKWLQRATLPRNSKLVGRMAIAQARLLKSFHFFFTEMAVQQSLIARAPYPLNNNRNKDLMTRLISSKSIPLTYLTSPYHHKYNQSSSSGGGIRRLIIPNASHKHTQGKGIPVEDSDSDSESDDEIDENHKPQNDPYLMNEDERREWRSKIRQVMSMMNPDNVEEEVDPDPDPDLELDQEEKRKKVQQLLSKYPLVVEEEDPDWPEDADGWGFNFSRFFDKITIKNNKKSSNDDDDDDDYDSENEIVWQDDNYIRPIKDITTADWEETVFKDISPLIILVHHRYKRPKENEKIRDQLDKAVQIIWNCRLPSPRCVAVDAVVETDLVSALQVSVFPELIFTKAGKILFRDKAIRNADELSKIMAFFYYGAGKPPCLKIVGDNQELIPSLPVNAQP